MSTISTRAPVPRVGGRFGRFALLNAVLVAGVVALGVVTYLQAGRKQATTAAVRTAPVARGVVLSTVSASGNVQAARTLSVDFATSGTVRSVAVKAGRHVAAGQVLGRLDDSDARVGVQQAQASLASAQAQLQQTLAGETTAQRRQDTLSVAEARTQVATATAAVATQRRTNALDRASLAAAFVQAQRQLRTDQGNLRGTVAKLHADEAQQATDQTASDQAQAAVATDQAAVATDQADQQRIALGLLDAQQNQTADKANSGTTQSELDDDAASIASWQREQQQGSFRLSQDQAKLSSDQQTASTASGAVTADEASVESDQATIVSLEKAIVQDRNAIAGAGQSRTAGLEKDAQALASAQRQVVAARQSVTAAKVANEVKQAPPQPSTLAQQRAAIVQAEAGLATAQRTLGQTVLRAPTAGVVAAVSGIAGQAVSGGGSSASAAASSASSSGSGGGSSSSGSAFVTLVDMKTMQVLAPFSETDAAKLRVGEPATVTLAALSGRQVPAHIVAVDTDSTLSSSVVTYDATFQLDRRVAGLKPGMTADVDVVTGERDDVLHVPTAAVTGTSVTVLRNGKQVRVPVVAGLRGDSTTEIQSGLKAGDEVVLPTATIATTGSTSGSGAGFAGGGLGGGFAGFARGGGFARRGG